MRAYGQRYKECVPSELFGDFEAVFEANFPDRVKEVKAAKTVPVDGGIFFIIKFTTSPSSVNGFVESFPEKELLLEWAQYGVESDRRRSSGFWRPPKWFIEPIEEGKVARYHPAYGDVHIYIDSSDKKASVVYIYGWFIKSYAKRKS